MLTLSKDVETISVKKLKQADKQSGAPHLTSSQTASSTSGRVQLGFQGV